MRKLLTYMALTYLAFFAASTLNAQTFSVVYNFGSQVGDPINHPSSGIIAQGRDGNLYSGSAGGQSDEGANFVVTPAGALTTLYSFTNGTDGSLPYGGLTLGTDGNFYGTAFSGNAGGGAPHGTVFRMTPAGTLDTIYTFTAGNDGRASSRSSDSGCGRKFLRNLLRMELRFRFTRQPWINLQNHSFRRVRRLAHLHHRLLQPRGPTGAGYGRSILRSIDQRRNWRRFDLQD